jgi:hypothetical protein
VGHHPNRIDQVEGRQNRKADSQQAHLFRKDLPPDGRDGYERENAENGRDDPGSGNRVADGQNTRPAGREFRKPAIRTKHVVAKKVLIGSCAHIRRGAHEGSGLEMSADKDACLEGIPRFIGVEQTARTQPTQRKDNRCEQKNDNGPIGKRDSCIL